MNKLTLLFLCLMWSCAESQSLSPSEFQSQIQNTPGAVVLDVRTINETKESGIISGARVIDYKGSDFKSEIEKLDKAKTYFVYCASGKRSGEAAKIMKQTGFQNVFTLDGGTKAWQKADFPLVNP